MATVIGQYTLQLNRSWMTTDGQVHIYHPPHQPNGGWYIRGSAPGSMQAFKAAGIALGGEPHAPTRAAAVAIAQSVAGCVTTLKQTLSQYHIVEHPHEQLKPFYVYLQKKPEGWRVWANGAVTSEEDTHVLGYVAEVSKYFHSTRAAALDALDQWMIDCPSPTSSRNAVVAE